MCIKARLFLLLILVVFMSFRSDVAGGETMDRIVAMVNGDIILNSELKNRIRVVQKVTKGANATEPARTEQMERDVLQQMVRERLTEAEVKRQKITVTPRELDEAIAQIKKDNDFTEAQLEYVVQQEGQTFAQFKDQIRKELERGHLLDRMLKSKTVITEAQVDAYLKTGKAEAGERHRMAIIFIPDREGEAANRDGEAGKLARDIHRRLKEGADFAKMAMQYSKGPAAEEGGDLGYISSEELAPAIAAAIKGLKLDDISDPFNAAGGYYILKVMDTQKVKMDIADAAVREKARRQLFQQELNRKFEEWIRDLEARAFIQISL